MSIELRWLRSFVSVAEEMHFSRAARKLNLAQPALTAHIRQLEGALGALLFERTNRMGGLTAAGRALLPEARILVERATLLKTTVHRAALGETGTLRLGIIPPAATSKVAATVRQLAKQFSGIELIIRQGDQAKLLDRLIGNELDLVIGRPAGDDALGQKPLFTEEHGIVVRADDPLGRMKRVPVGSLANKNLLLLRDNPHFGQLLLGHAARHGARLIPLHSAEDFPSLHWMVRAGLGIAPCSLLLADGLPRGLVAKPLHPAPSRLQINAIWHGKSSPPAATRLIELLKQSV